MELTALEKLNLPTYYLFVPLASIRNRLVRTSQTVFPKGALAL